MIAVDVPAWARSGRGGVRGAAGGRQRRHRAAAGKDRRWARTAGDAAADNHFRGTVSDFLYHGDVTVYIVTTAGGATIEALSANSAAGRTKFFEVGDAVDLSWPAAAGHFIAG